MKSHFKTMSMATPIQKLFQLCCRTFSKRPSCSLSSEQLDSLVKAMNEIKASDLKYDANEVQELDRLPHNKAPVTYMHVYQDRSFTMALFVVKAGSTLPLHDHPEMHGIMKVIDGKIRLISYTASNQLPGPNTKTLNSLSSGVKTVTRNSDLFLSPEDGCCMLSPHEGNIHEIQPLTETAAFLDILAPPYENDSSCHYYKELPGPEQGNMRSLSEIPQPKSYWCNTLKYRGPPLLSDYYVPSV